MENPNFDTGASGSNTDIDFRELLHVYIYDYLVKRNLHSSAQSFRNESNLSSIHPLVNVQPGFLSEWWVLFLETFLARVNKNISAAAASQSEGLDQYPSEIPQQMSSIHSRQPFNPSQLPTAEAQEQQWLQTRSLTQRRDIGPRLMTPPRNNENVLGAEGQPICFGNVSQQGGFPMQTTSPVFFHADTAMLDEMQPQRQESFEVCDGQGNYISPQMARQSRMTRR